VLKLFILETDKLADGKIPADAKFSRCGDSGRNLGRSSGNTSTKLLRLTTMF